MVKHKYISFENNFISNNNKKMKNESIFIHNNNQVLLKNDKFGFSFKKINIKNNYKRNIFLYYIIVILTILQKIKTDSDYISITLSLSCNNFPLTNTDNYEITSPDINQKIIKFKNNVINDFNNFFKNIYCINKIEFSSLNYEGVVRAKGMFENCINLKEIDFGSFDASKITDMSRMFYNCTSLTSVNFRNFKTSSLTNMEYMFSNCKSLETLDLTIFDTSNVLYMNNLFEDCTRINSLIISSFNTKNVIQMESMFQNCQSLTTLDLNNFYTSSARQIYNMFYGCTGLISIKIDNFDTFQITNFANLFYDCSSLLTINFKEKFVTDLGSDMSYMFYNCNQLKGLDLSNFNTERVIKMNSMFEKCLSLEEINNIKFENTRTVDMGRLFYECKELKSIDLENFKTSQVQNMNSMFYDCAKLQSLNLSNFETSKVINMKSMFSGCESINSFDLGNFDTSQVKDMSSMFEKCTSITSLDINSFETNNLEKVDAMFRNCNSLKYISLSSFTTQNVHSMKSMFYGCINLESIDLSNFNTEKVIYMDEMFYKCSSFIFLDLSQFKISNVYNMGYMFYGCKSLTSMKLPKFEETELRVTNTSHMFMGCSSISDLDLSHFDLDDVITFDYMFAECSFLKNLNLNNWKTSRALTMDYMFAGCSSLRTLNINSFYTPILQSIKGMFYGCVSLISLDLSKLDTSHVTTTSYMFYKAFSITSIKFINYKDNSTIKETFFYTPSVRDMSYMFAYCTNLKELDLSLFDTHNVVEMSNMFKECHVLTSVNLSGINAAQVRSMENMFYNCSNIGYINLYGLIDDEVNNMENILFNTPNNTVFCFNNITAPKFYHHIKPKTCYMINCSDYAIETRKRINFTDNICISNCSDKSLFEFEYYCYQECPNDTVTEEFMCYRNYSKGDKCNYERVLLSLCEITDIDEYKNMEFEAFTLEKKTEIISNIEKLFKDGEFTIISEKVRNGEIITREIFNNTFEISMLSNKNRISGLAFIDVQDCENILRQKNEIDDNIELILLKIEYPVLGFRIPIIEYKVFLSENGGEIDLSTCNKIKFYYLIPGEINEENEYLHNPYNEYNSKLCYQYTTDNNTDIILYDRRKYFNDNNMSLCETNCKYVEYSAGTIKCECEIKTDFNKFLSYSESQIENLIYKFKNNKINNYNFGVVKCFQMLFSSEGFFGNYGSILFVVLLGLNVALNIFFCLKGFQTIYSDIKNVSFKDPRKNKSNNNLNNSQRKRINSKNIITSENPPKKNSGAIISIKALKMNKAQNNLIKSDKPKVKNSSGLDSKNIFKKDDNKLFPSKSNNKKNKDLDDIADIDVDIDTNLLSYEDALKKDNRPFIRFYLSLLKSRNLLFSIFNNDYNSLIMKIDFVLYTFGFCIGITTIFFTDKSVQEIYLSEGTLSLLDNVINHLSHIFLSAILVSIIKSITACFIYSDKMFLKTNEINDMDEEEQFNNTLIKIMSKNMTIFILNYIFLFIFWIYVGSFCAIYKNSQTFLIINGGVCFIVVLIINFLFYFIPALLRMVSLNGKDKACLYKASQYIQMI